MAFYVYVLYNVETGKLYKGHTQNLEKRLAEHTSGHTKTTSHHSGAWKLIYYETFETREMAIAREKYFKTAAGRKFLKNKVDWSGSSTDTCANVPGGTLGTGGE